MTPTMTPRSTRRRPGARALVAAGAVSLALGLGACSAAGDPGAAAVVDGRVVSQADVQTAVAELPREITQGVQVDPVQVVSLFVARDAVEETAREYTGLVTQEDARQFLRQIDEDAGRTPVQYSEPTLDVIAINLMVGQLTQTDVAAPVLNERISQLSGDDVTLNPRYGSVSEDGELLFGVYDHDWLADDGAGAGA